MLGIIKTSDKRFMYMASNIKSKYVYSDKIDDFHNIDTLILPIGGVDRFLFIKDTALNLRDILEKNNLKKIIAGKINEDLKNIAKEDNIILLSYLDEQYYLYSNGYLTAYVLFKKILNDFDEPIYDKKILITGWGYCARAIYDYLSKLNNNISIYCKDYHDKKDLCFHHIPYESLKKIDDYDIIINTVENNIIKGNLYLQIKKDAKLYDIASYPYGFNLEDASKYGAKVEVLPKLPSYIPKSAGRVLYDTIIRLIEE